ncbi:MAG: pre-peptidase C-terminal domain-containing protein, partial [Planctomycetaceae bacterium]|nr:pre-peptidase C-terminal domain-containing protein [Planctomycetaceae bacterium]
MITKILELVRAIFVSKVDSDKRSIGRRKLTIETLESRELLSASPLGQVLSDLDELYSPVVCAPAISIPANASASSNAGQVSQAPPAPLSETFTLHSNPNSNFTIYLDFDGHVTSGTPWNEGFRDFVTPAFTMDADPNFSEAELEMIQYIWQRVSEDFMPFDVDVTTEAPPDNYLTKETPTGDSDGHWGVRVAIGGSSYDWLGDSAGGVALLGSFSWDTDTPCFAFNQYDEKAIAEAVSHEVGHTLGLSHDGDSTRGYEYYAQEGEATGWAPIMGAGYYSDVVQWSKGEYTGNTNTEDDLAIITGEITNESTGMFGGNGFTYRQDDHGNSIQSATELPTSENSFIVTGIVERNTDVDYFVIDITSNSVIDLKITSGSRDANLDILAKIYDSSGNVIETFNDQLTLHAEFLNLSLVAGVYYLSIEGTGREYISETMIGYTDYGSIGSYKIEATITREAEPLDSPTLEVTGVTTTTVSLDWSVVDGATGYLLQWSTNSSVWDVQTQVQFNSNETEYTVEGLESGTLYYFRVRAVSENAFSNWVMVQATTEREVIVDDDYEDNDSFDIVDAAVLDSEADHTPNLGVIEAERTINDLKLVDGNDYFKFEITSNGSADSYVRIAFDNSVGDIDFQLFDGNRNFVRSSSTTANSETISLNELNAGVYYVRIFSYRGAENPNYTLTIVPPTTSANEPPPANTTIENNNSFETAFDFGAITALTAIDGLELKAGEIADYYKFTFTATGDANSYARIDFTNANGDLAVQLFDSSRMSVKS